MVCIPVATWSGDLNTGEALAVKEPEKGVAIQIIRKDGAVAETRV